MKKYESFGNAYLNGKVYGNLYPSNNDNKQEAEENQNNRYRLDAEEVKNEALERVKIFNSDPSLGNKGDMVRIPSGYYLIEDDYVGQTKTVHLVSLNDVRKTMSLERFYKEARLIEPSEATNIARFHTNTNGHKKYKYEKI